MLETRVLALGILAYNAEVDALDLGDVSRARSSKGRWVGLSLSCGHLVAVAAAVLLLWGGERQGET